MMSIQNNLALEVPIIRTNLLHKLFGESLQSARRPGTKNQGINYEIKICALMALRCLNPDYNISNFWLAQNVKHSIVGDFDDVILTTEKQNGEMYTYCMQLKHFGDVERRKKLKYETFYKDFKNRKKNPFNLESYLGSISNNRSRKNSENLEGNLKYILYTNKDMDKKEDRFKPYENEDVDLINTGGHAFCFHEFKYKKACKAETDQVDGQCEEQLDSELLKKLAIFCTQEHEENLKCIISKTLKILFQIDDGKVEDITDKYILYVTDWMNGEYGENNMLSKELVKFHLIDILIKPYMYQLPQIATNAISSEIVKKCHSILESYNLILVENFKPHDDLHKDCMDVFSKILQAAIQHHRDLLCFSIRSKRSSIKLERKESISMMWDDPQNFHLWKNGMVHLTLKVDSEENLQQILSIVKYVPGVKFMLFCENFQVSKISDGHRVLKNFKGLEKQHRDIFLEEEVKLQGRSVKMKDLLLRNSHKCESELSIVQLVQVLLNKFSLGVRKSCLQLPNIFINRSLEHVIVNCEIFNERIVHVIVCESKKAFLNYAKSVKMNIAESQVCSLFNCSQIENKHKFNKLVSESGQVSIKSDFILPKEYTILLIKEDDVNFVQHAIAKRKIGETIFKMFTLTYYFTGVYKIIPYEPSEFRINVMFTQIKDLKTLFVSENITYNTSEIYDISTVNIIDIPVTCKYLTCTKEDFDEKIKNISISYSLCFYQLHMNSKSEFILEWLGSNKSCKNIRKFRYSDNKPDNYDVNQCYKYNKVNLIWGSPGIGKTVLMNYLACNCPPDMWSVQVYLNEHLKYYDNKTVITTSAVDHVKYFLKYETMNVMDRIFVDEYLHHRKVCLYFDGFDEVAPDYEDPVCNLLKLISNAGFTIFISSRPLQVAILELRLNAIARTIQPFTALDQLEYISKYFKSMIEHSDERVDRYVNELLSQRHDMTSLDEQFSGIPLQTLMIANIYLHECREYCKGKTFVSHKNIDVLHLYKQFIKYKFDEFEAKHKLDESIITRTYYRIIKKQSIALYKICAVKAVFPSMDVELGEDVMEFLQEVKQGKEKIGLIERVNNDNTPVFVHRTFAEYLVGIYLAENFERPENKVLISLIFKDQSYDVIRNIFDRLMASGCNLHIAVLNRDESKVIQLLGDEKEMNKVDLGGRSALHLAMSWGARHIVPENNLINILGDDDTPNNFITKLNNMHNLCRGYRGADHIVKLILTKSGKHLRKVDTIFNETPLDYAIRVLALNSIDLFLATAYKFDKKLRHFRKSFKLLFDYRVKRNQISKLFMRKTNLLVPAMDHKQLLFLCTLYDYHNVVKAINRMRPRFTKVLEYQYGEWEIPYLVHLAAFYRSDKILKKLLKHGLNVNLGDRVLKNTPLHWAAKMGHVSTVRLLISSKANVNAANIYDVTPLMYATLERHIEIVLFLLSAGADPSATDSYNLTALNMATKYGHTDVETVILGATNDDDVQFLYNKTIILLRASEKGHLDVVRLLFSSGMDANVVNSSGWTALMFASINGHHEVAMFLVKLGADVNATDSNNETALMKAAMKGHFRVTLLLLKSEADIKARNDNKDTAFMMASAEGHLDVMRLLILWGASVNDGDKFGKTALMGAAQNGQKSAVGLLIQSGADVNATNSGGWNALMYAALKGYADIVRMLTGKENLEGDMCQNLENPQSNTIRKRNTKEESGSEKIEYSVPENSYDQDEYLLLSSEETSSNSLPEKSPSLVVALPNAVNNSGWSPLMYAAMKGHLAVVQELLTLDVDVNAVDKNGDSALMHAAKRGHGDVVEELLKHGANIHAVNKKDFDALKWASKFNHTDVVKQLAK